ncbi:MAG: hypothetical protein D6689_12515 [Deltaproteobacteria bacterium]|nr:MAG: hypothetical protein D6689_12515 [Deltaproteobacteria bacterium]
MCCLVAAACSGKSDAPRKAPAAAQPADAAPFAGVSGHHRANAKWVPAEYKRGGRKWRDAGVYVDGVPIGVLWFGELPAKLRPVWLEDVRMLDFRAGQPGPREEKIKVRRYRLAEYLEAAGVDLARVKAVHIYGGNHFVAEISGPELRRVRDRLYFGFGSETSGKPLVYFPEDLRTSTTFDHIAAVCVYIDKRPPDVSDNGDTLLDGKVIDGIPYYGEPMRGGIRVYKDDRLAVWIKRRMLAGAEKLAERTDAGELRWKLLPYLAKQGVDVTSVQAADLIYDERKVARLDRAALEQAYFVANPQSSGQIVLGPSNTPVQALALFTEPPPPPPDEPDPL